MSFFSLDLSQIVVQMEVFNARYLYFNLQDISNLCISKCVVTLLYVTEYRVHYSLTWIYDQAE